MLQYLATGIDPVVLLSEDAHYRRAQDMTIKIEITADNAEGLTAQLHEFVQTFVNMAKATEPAPFDKPAPERVTPLPTDTPTTTAETTAPRRRRQAAVVVEPATTEAEPEAKAAPAKVTPDEVRATLNKLRSEKGNDALGKVVTQFAAKFSEIPETSYPKLHEAALKALAA